eukprot:jgi/Botrbrau1/6948/Bobra.0215s0025.1
MVSMMHNGLERCAAQDLVDSPIRWNKVRCRRSRHPPFQSDRDQQGYLIRRNAVGSKSEDGHNGEVPRRDFLGLAIAFSLQSASLPLVGSLPAQAGEEEGRGAGPQQPRFLDPADEAAVEKAFLQAASLPKAPTLLRLAFHDAGTHRWATRDGGANGSLAFELKRPENKGLARGWRVLEDVMSRLQKTSPAAAGLLSFADLVALGGAFAVAATGGPRIRIPVGRRDAVEADPTGRLPEETFDAPKLIAYFGDMGLSAREFVALSGSHTLGNKGFGEPLKFDNVYYKELLKKPWADPSNDMASMIGLPSDKVLPDDPICRPIIEEYAADEALFFRDFSNAYLKLTTLGASWS